MARKQWQTLFSWAPKSLQMVTAAIKLKGSCSLEEMENGKATDSSILAWRIPWTGEPGGLQSLELHRVRHDWATNTYLGRKVMTNLDSILKSSNITLTTKVHIVKAMVFPVVMYGCESWTIKKAECWRTDVFEQWCWRRFLRVLGLQEIQPVCPKGNQSWILIGRTYVEAKAPILWPPNEKNWLIGKDPDAGKGWRQEEKGMTEDKLVGWHHWFNGH